MRNLKRALSLALASVMLLGMMVVGTSASYPDVTSENNEEAIAVMQMLKVMEGDDKGNFNPGKAVTRNEMAVIMCKLLDLNTKDYAGSCPFTDVPAWAEPYVAACYANKIVSGTSATTYSGDATVTTAQAALMVLKALGYFQYAADFGEDWMVSTVKQASKISLFDGLTSNANAALTRNDVAQLALNALEADVVDTDGNGGTTIKGEGFEITTGSAKYATVMTDKKDYQNRPNNSDGKNTQQLVEKLFGTDVKYEKKNDDLGRPGYQWVYKTDKVGPFADEADEVVVATKAYAGLMAAYIDKIDDDADAKYNVPDQKINGRAWQDADKDSDGNYIQAGDVIEYYLKDGKITAAVVTRYIAGKVTKVDTKVTKADKEDDVTAYVTVKTIDGNTVLVSAAKDTDFAGFSYAKNDVILLAVSAANNNKKVLDSRPADSVEGTITAVRSDKVAIDGTYYELACAKPALKEKGVFYLNAAGQIIDKDTTEEKSDNYAYIYSLITEKAKNSYGIETDITTAYYVAADGTTASAVVNEDDVANLQKALTKVTESGKPDNYVGVVAYSIDSDKEFNLETAKDTIETAAKPAKAVDKNNAVIADGVNANSKTKFIFVEKTSTKVKVNVVEGYKNVNIATTATVTAITDDDDALYAFVAAKNGNVEATGYIAVMLDPDFEETKDDDNTYYTFNVSIDGEDTTITTKKSSEKDTLSKLAKGAVFSYNLDGEYVVDVNNSTETGITFNTGADVSAVNDDYVLIGGTQYNLGTETVYTITMEYKKDGKTLDTVSVAKGGEFSKDNKVTFTTDDGDLDIVFVIEEIK